MLNGKTLNKVQTHEMAIGLSPFISSYVESHKEAYIQFLKASNLRDEQYYNPDKEAQDEQRKCG